MKKKKPYALYLNDSLTYIGFTKNGDRYLIKHDVKSSSKPEVIRITSNIIRNQIIKELYNFYGITQKEIAKLLGISQSTVSNIVSHREKTILRLYDSNLFKKYNPPLVISCE